MIVRFLSLARGFGCVVNASLMRARTGAASSSAARSSTMCRIFLPDPRSVVVVVHELYGTRQKAAKLPPCLPGNALNRWAVPAHESGDVSLRRLLRHIHSSAPTSPTWSA
jgi:hypothetical protein